MADAVSQPLPPKAHYVNVDLSPVSERSYFAVTYDNRVVTHPPPFTPMLDCVKMWNNTENAKFLLHTPGKQHATHLTNRIWKMIYIEAVGLLWNKQACATHSAVAIKGGVMA